MAFATGHCPLAFSDPAAEMAVEVDPTGRFTRTNQVLGQGASKTVYKGFDRIEGIEVAWNQASLMGCDIHTAHRLLHSEVAVLKKLRHRNIMKFVASWVDHETGMLNFITEYFNSGCLKRHRLQHRFISPKLLKRWAWQILQGLVYLHGHNPPIIHRDLKCDNIFIHGVSGEVKIGDLGLARLMEQDSSMCNTCLGTPEFMAPEMFNEHYNEKVDIYAFGMCLLEMVTMSYPYSECKSACQIYRNVVEGIPPQALHRVSDAETRRFIELCICPDPEKRPSAKELAKHKYFDSLPEQVKQASAEPLPPEPLEDSDSDQEDREHENSDGDLDSMYEGANMDTAFGNGPKRRSSHTKLDMESLAEACRRATQANGVGEASSHSNTVGTVNTTPGVSGYTADVHTQSTVESVSEWEDLGEEASVFKDRTNFCIQHREGGTLPFADVVYFDLVVAGRREPKRLMFSFDTETDTVEAVGLELEEEFDLTEEEREQFTDVLRHELQRVLLQMPEDDGQGFETFVESTFGSVVVSMSLDDWQGEQKNTFSLTSQQLDSYAKKKEIALKIKLEKKGGDKLSPENGSIDPLKSGRNVENRSAERTENNDATSMSSQTSFERPMRSLARVSFDRPGKAWENLLRHFQKGGQPPEHPVRRSLQYDIMKPETPGSRPSVDQKNLGSDKVMVFRTDTANANAMEASLGQRERVSSPRVLRRMLSSAVTPHSASNMLHHVKAMAGTVRQIQSAAVFLTRNSLDAKRVREVEGERKMKKTHSKRNIFGRLKPEGTKSMNNFFPVQDTLRTDHELRTFSEGQHPLKGGTSTWGQLRRAVKKAPWPLRRRRSKGT